MMDAARTALKTHVDTFATIYPADPVVGVTMVISAFVSCYSMMGEDARVRTCTTLFELIRDVGGERFEDGPDFLAFLKEKITEKKDIT